MKPTATLLPALLLACTLFSCKETPKETDAIKPVAIKEYVNLNKAAWLIGNWGDTSDKGVLTESWIKTNDSVYHGESYFVVKNDTVFSENIELEEANGKLAYIVTVPGQNEEKPVRFEMTLINDTGIIFENPQHDFPNKITYNKITNDSIVAQISGTQNGKHATETFAMKRQK